MICDGFPSPVCRMIWGCRIAVCFNLLVSTLQFAGSEHSVVQGPTGQQPHFQEFLGQGMSTATIVKFKLETREHSWCSARIHDSESFKYGRNAESSPPYGKCALWLGQSAPPSKFWFLGPSD